MPSDVGEYRALLDSVLEKQGAALSYLSRDWPEIEQWRQEARGKLQDLLAFRPKPAALEVKTERTGVHQGVSFEEVSWEVGYGPRCHAWVLKPAGATGKLPAVLALHDHGGFKWFGKEKIADDGRTYPLTVDHRHSAYGGRPWANELAKRGFVVLVHDTFLFGSRKVSVGSLPQRYQQRFKDLRPGTDAYIKAYNAFAGEHEHVMAKSCFTAGTTWPGIYAYEDRRAVDYLLTRKDVDADRIGCGGLSGGGLRTVLLAGTDPRIQAANPIGFMSTWQDFLHDRVWTHTWMLYIPHCARYLDFPDILTLNAPKPTLVQYDEEDPLYSLKGQRDADQRLAATFKKLGARDAYKGSFYPGPHKFDVIMQEEAFNFFDKALKT